MQQECLEMMPTVNDITILMPSLKQTYNNSLWKMHTKLVNMRIARFRYYTFFVEKSVKNYVKIKQTRYFLKRFRNILSSLYC
jgi:hypothetical protein